MKVADYGTWRSPITTEAALRGGLDFRHSLGSLGYDRGRLYWSEGRPAEAGRATIVCHDRSGELQELLPPPFNLRSRTHEYGGGDFIVDAGCLFFSSDHDGRWYCYPLEEGGVRTSPFPITEAGGIRYADPCYDLRRSRLIVVAEEVLPGDREPVDRILALPLSMEEPLPPTKLVEGADFYSSPRLSPDGTQLTWISWNHPNMPWDGSELWLAEVDTDGSLINQQQIAGGDEESIFQPEWSPSGELHWVSDRSGWWNLYRLRNQQQEALCEVEAEFGLPQWSLGESTYGFLDSERIACTYTSSGRWFLGELNTTTKKLREIPAPYTEIAHLKVFDGHIFARCASPVHATGIVEISPESSECKTHRSSLAVDIDSSHCSTPKLISFPSEGMEAKGLFYPPHNPDYRAEGAPPLVVMRSWRPYGSSIHCT